MTNRSHTVALALYCRALRQAGVALSKSFGVVDEKVAANAEALALPGDRGSAAEGPKVLKSIFARLMLPKEAAGQPQRAAVAKHYYAPNALPPKEGTMADIVLPRRLDGTAGAKLATERAAAISEIERELAAWLAAEQESAIVQEASLHALLQRHCWSLPAPVAGADDVSLFEYARIGAAVAVCLDAQQGEEDGAPALLVGGDVSGVQEWLYTFSSTGAAKSLRGRSFYLQLLSEMIAQYVLDELGLPAANLLYAGGGSFYILAPTTIRSDLKKIEKAIGEKLLAMHNGDLYVSIAAAEMTRTMLLQQNGETVGDAWGYLGQRLTEQKTRRFANLDDQQMAEAIGSAMVGSGLPGDSCRVCGRNVTEQERADKTATEIESADGGVKCGLCNSFEELGNQLRTAGFLVVQSIEPEAGGEVVDWQRGLRRFGVAVSLYRYAGTAIREQWTSQGDGLTRIYTWSDRAKLHSFPGNPDEAKTVWAYRPLAQCVPLKTDGDTIERYHDGNAIIADFEHIAKASDGVKRWGVLRMDVDYLGRIFQSGIPKEDHNLCRVVVLSGLLRLFFEGYVPLLAERFNETVDDKHMPRAYMMYAGGDDLFLVGAWSCLPELAHAIRTEFGKFVCENGDLTISGGISLALSDKYPLYQAAEDAGEAEHMAKELEGKDGLALLGQAVKWGEPYEKVYARVREIESWLGDDGTKLPRSFLMTLRSIDAEWRTWRRQESGKLQKRGIAPRYEHANNQLYLGPWQWKLIYSLSRAAERTKGDALKTKVKQLAEDIVGREIRTLGLTARWVELLTRKGDERT